MFSSATTYHVLGHPRTPSKGCLCLLLTNESSQLVGKLVALLVSAWKTWKSYGGNLLHFSTHFLFLFKFCPQYLLNWFLSIRDGGTCLTDVVSGPSVHLLSDPDLHVPAPLPQRSTSLWADDCVQQEMLPMTQDFLGVCVASQPTISFSSP